MRESAATVVREKRITRPDSIKSFTLFLLKTSAASRKLAAIPSLRIPSQPFEQLPSKFLKFAESLLILDKEAVIFERMIGVEMRAQHHVAQTDGVRQQCIFFQLFQRGGWIVMVHRFLGFRQVP